MLSINLVAGIKPVGKQRFVDSSFFGFREIINFTNGTRQAPFAVIFLQSPTHFAFGIALCDGFSLIVKFLAFRKRNLDLGATPLKIDHRRDNGESSFAALLNDLGYFSFVK